MLPRASLSAGPTRVLLALGVGIVTVEFLSVWDQRHLLRSWPSLVEAGDGSWTLLAPLVCVASATCAMFNLRSRELIEAFPDGGMRKFAAPGIVVGLMAAMLHGLFVAGLVIWGFVHDLPGRPRLAPVPSVLLGLFTFSLMGVVVARLLGNLLAPFAALSMALTIFYLSRPLGLANLFDLGGVSIVLIGLVPDPLAMVFRAAWFAMASLVMALLAAKGLQAARSAKFLLVAALAVAFGSLSLNQSRDGFVDAPVQWVCTQGEPKVCVAAEYEDRLLDYRDTLLPLSQAARQLGIPVPEQGYRQAVGVSPGAGSFNVGQRLDLRQLSFDMIQFSSSCSLEWGADEIGKAETAAGYLMSQVSTTPPAGTVWPTLREGQAAWRALDCVE